ncbi:MAG: ATP-binding protein, partial [Actinobacteria bacterium]|nr:ATP-binding protein [Actinomycetota bacterium]
MSEELTPGKLPNPLEQEVMSSISGRIAIYDNMRSTPRVVEISYDSITRFLDETPQRIYSISHELGGKIPYTIIKEVVENLIHANFTEIIITILNNGNHIIISDQGPGIADKEKAFLPGFTSATSVMKKYIRGVGSGLPIVKENIFFSGGSVDITD